jgi:uncharacterized protein (DUF1684 family)
LLLSTTRPHAIVLIVLSAFLLGCSNSDRSKERSGATNVESTPVFSSSDQERQYITDLRKFRAEKDSFLQVSPRSPIKKEDRRAFRHLNYFNVNPAFVVRATLHRNENPPPLTITTTTGENRDAINYGTLEFTLLGRKLHLSVFKFSDRRGEQSLFVPFTDSTSAHETYGAGRYIDLDENETGEYILDFNRAYNPYCAYNENYSCPIPPRENRLPIAITAGEKVYH